MFDFLKGGKASVQLVLDRPRPVYAPGETVQAKVTVVGEKDLKIQQGRIALVYHEEYQYAHEERSTDSDGHTETSTEKSWATDEREVSKHVFLGETTIKAGSKQDFEFAFTVPNDALPSLEGEIIKIKWLVKATLDRKLASYVVQKIEVYVPSTAPETRAGDYGVSNEPGEAEMAFALGANAFARGEVIEGKLVIRPKKAFEANEVRVELEERERVPRDEGNEKTRTEKIKLAGSTKFEPGKEMVIPFQVTVSSSAPVTCRTPNGSITWKLKGVLARRFRGDTLVEQDIVASSVRQ